MFSPVALRFLARQLAINRVPGSYNCGPQIRGDQVQENAGISIPVVGGRP